MTELTNPMKIVVIGIMEANDGEKEMRFKLNDEGKWKLDLIVDNVNGTVHPAPECFEPIKEVTDKLDASLLEYAQGLMDWLEAIDAGAR